MIRRGSGTPWGVADHAEEVLPGIVSVETPSHGGYWVSAERLVLMPEPLRAIGGSYCGSWGRQWFEEDCAWCAVVLAFTGEFEGVAAKHWTPGWEGVGAARLMLQSVYPAAFATWQALHWDCTACEARMGPGETPRKTPGGLLCEGCWDEVIAAARESGWYEEGDGQAMEADLIGSQWYHEDLP